MEKAWMHADRRTKEYEDGVEYFLKFALRNAANPNYIHCPCEKCGNLSKNNVRVIREHLYFNGVDQRYKNWIWHGEGNVQHGQGTEHGQWAGSETVDMCEGAFDNFTNNLDEFCSFVEEGVKPLYVGCDKYSKLSTLVKLFNLKATHGWSDSSFSDLLVTLGDILPKGNLLPLSMYEAKKTLSSLGMGYEKIHACPNDCILYRNEYEDEIRCPKCDLSRWKVNKKSVEKDGVPAKVLWYFPPIPRFKRMFKSCKIAENLTWHADHKVSDGLMRHPADSPAWKLVDQKWPDFASEPRNLRLAISADGINPHSSLSSRYSCWPILLVTYNLPPWLCMKRKFMMLTLLISGPRQPGNDIDVYLQPLIDDLKALWQGIDGVYDGFRKNSFTLKGALLWTINDFPAYGNLSGCTVKGYKACPICGENTDAVRLQHGRKICFQGHRRFLPRHHPYRKKMAAFNNRQEFGEPPTPLSGEEVLERVAGINYNFGKQSKKSSLGGEAHAPCWKKRSIFFDLEYWKSLHIRHCLDVMHIEKNVCESLIGTLLNIPGKTKDGVAARLDLMEMGVRLDLAPEIGKNRTYLPAAAYTLSKDEKRSICKSFLGMKVPEGYSSNVSNLVSMQELKLFGLKSHDCHTLIQQLLPVAIRSVLPKHVRYAITRLCLFFNSLCSKVIDVAKLDKIQSDLVETLCLLEMIFPPSFFDIMVHLSVHLIREVRLCGPVYFRWMYPFERYMKVLKGYVKNRNRPEGCIAERFISEEAVEYCSEYLSGLDAIGIPSPRIGVSSGGRPISGARVVTVSREEWEQAHRCVLENASEIESYAELHKAYLNTIYSSKKKSEKWLLEEHNRLFCYWLRDKVAAEIANGKDITESVRRLAHGPPMSVVHYEGYEIGGCRYHTKGRDNVRSVQNSGVSLVANTMQVASAKDKKPVYTEMCFYGIIQEIWELDYKEFRVPLFKCQWVENNKGIKTDDLGFVLVNLNRIGHKRDVFALATQVKQVFYVEDPVDSSWSVVLAAPNREYNNGIVLDEVGDTVCDLEPLANGLPLVEEFDHLMGEDGNTYKREYCEGIWIDHSKKRK